ncbi:ArsC/Spx/MgsR family protein [Jannaschia sp. 2305UL9-9]|uniref:ArsC/Spx/MgsR family protein n=1 Tax=Jannaschia sp. 2305UL9-9 TaxID=3121638 RepID=UPI003526DEA8
MVIVNGLKACDTCRKALRALSDAGQEAQLRDFRDVPPQQAEIARWFAQLGDAMVNRRSTTWRNLSEEERAGEPVALMLAQPTLIKRPVIEIGDTVHSGWTAQTKAALGL